MPPYCYYCLCSTEPGKILKTIRTRAEEITVRPLRRDDMEGLLEAAIAQGDLADPGDDVFLKISEVADGCPRQALVLLEQTIGLPPKRAAEAVEAFAQDERELIELCRKLVNRSTGWKTLAKIYTSLPDRDPEKIRRAILGYLAACLKKAGDQDAERYTNMILDLSEHTFDAGEPKLLAMLYLASTQT